MGRILEDFLEFDSSWVSVALPAIGSRTAMNVVNGLLEVALGLTLDQARQGARPSDLNWPLPGDSDQAPSLVFLGTLAEELKAEQDTCMLEASKVERARMSRLADAPNDRQWPVQYLVGCHRRSIGLAQRVQSDGSVSETDKEMAVAALQMVRQLAVSYAGFILEMQMFPQPPPAEARGGGQLLDSYLMQYSVEAQFGMGSTASSLMPEAVVRERGVEPIHPEFLPDFVARFGEEEVATNVLGQLGKALSEMLSRLSILGDFGTALTVLANVLSSSSVASHLCKTDAFLPKNDGSDLVGRVIEDATILGAAFGISAIPDIMDSPVLRSPAARSPDVPDGCFSGDDPTRQAIHTSSMSIQMSLDSLQTSLHRIVTNLLKNPGTKERMLAWLGAALHVNKERTKIQPDLKNASTDGFMINLCSVLLRLCRPFLDVATGKAWARLDARYISDPRSRGCAFDDDTRLGLAQGELQEWMQESVLPNDPTSYHFICECFFLTANALRLGVFKAMDNVRNMMRSAREWEREADLAMHGASNDPMMSQRARAMKLAASRYKNIGICFQATLHQRELLDDIVAYYSLMAAYFPRVALGGAAPASGFSLPLPSPAPKEFLSFPEYYVENMCQALSWIGRINLQLLNPNAVEQFMLFFALFLGSHDYVKNPYLRGKMVEALSSYIPTEDEGMDESNPWGRSHVPAGSQEVTAMINAHPLVIQHLIKALVLLFVEIERTDRHNAFYEKFSTRYQIGEVMVYLWDHPGHREAWKHVVENDPKLYIRFVNMMINDSQHLLQEALEALPEVRDIESRMADQESWKREPSSTREELLQQLESHRRTLNSDFALSAIYLKLMEITSSDPSICARFFDVQIRDRQARILNFFLRYMTIPAERKRLKLKEPEKYGWKPRELLASLAQIHANIFMANSEAWSAAVAADTDYYGTDPSILDHLISILTNIGTNPAVVQSIDRLRASAIEAVKNTAVDDENFEDAPEEFEDPLSCRLMKDPVKLPSGQVLDRSTILQHLLTDTRDPFSREAMTEDDLVEMPDLREQIHAWMAEKSGKAPK